MHKFLILLLLSSTIGFAQEPKYLSENYEFEVGDIVYLFGNDVKLRDSPDTESNVLSLLKIGTEIKILEKTDDSMLFEGIDSPWYKVKYENKTGYVLGALISMDKQRYNSITYLIALKKEGSELFLKTRVLENDKNYTENTVSLATHIFTTTAYGNRGLTNVKSVFGINYMAEACGVDGGGIYLFYNDGQLIKAIAYSQISDAGIYWFHEDYIFPTDEEGTQGKIAYSKEYGETKEEETEWIEIKKTKRLLEWKNNKIFPKIEPTED